MKKLINLLLWVALFSPVTLYAQECMGIVLKEGSGFEMVTSNGNGKQMGRLVYKIKKVSKDGSDVVVDMDFESFDAKGKSQMANSMQMRCNGNELRVDASSMMMQDQNKQYEAFDMKFTSKDIIFPAKLSVGQTLPDASLHGEGSSGPMAMTTDMAITNRKVEGKETVNVPAGTFDTYKVTSDMNVTSRTVVKIAFDFNTVSYRSDKVLWDIKTETYRKGKLISITELSKIF
ncbi:TapB family protein [Salmonirosea aquatica]|uniref:DUF3108 domain-containing protein n=1 Tax=Salmonirosea aquatica TaxID=2654236 RepID=A0A7C9BGR2_9BACT|nr:hypothetical protein [Cytophagaceae bacterium SJW1-29]